jgi:hypothetical protein
MAFNGAGSRDNAVKCDHSSKLYQHMAKDAENNYRRSLEITAVPSVVIFLNFLLTFSVFIKVSVSNSWLLQRKHVSVFTDNQTSCNYK